MAALRSERTFRLLVVAAALGLTVLSLLGYIGWKRERTRLLGFLDPARHATASRRIGRETARHHAELAVARALVHDVLERPAAAEAAPLEPLEQRGRQLPRARELARRALSAQPNSWQAAMLVGAATYLEWSIARDRRLFTEAGAWEEPLLKAVLEAPGKAEPRRFLVSAYLEVWPSLSDAKKALARTHLTAAFREDPEAYRLLAPSWLEVAADTREAFGPIPDRPEAWQLLTETYGQRRQWQLFCQARSRQLDALETVLEARLAEAERRLRLGDFYNGRSLLLRLISEAPPDSRFAPLVERALGQYPPGLHGLRSTDAIRAWLDWALELAELDIQGLSPPIVSRLAGAVDDLDPPTAAMAALIGGELANAERFEKLADHLRSEAWTPYLIAKARWLLAAARPEEAAATLANVDQRAARRTKSYWLLRERLARAQGDLVELVEIEEELANLRSASWESTLWRFDGRRLFLQLLPSTAGAGLELVLDEVPAAGAVLQVGWDGRTVAVLPVTPARRRIVLEVAVDTTLHRLELRVVAGGQVAPAVVTLLPALPRSSSS